MSISYRESVAILENGDAALRSGDLSGARHHYTGLLDTIRGPSRSAGEAGGAAATDHLLLTGVLEHRVGVVAYLAGDTSGAEQAFRSAADLFSEAADSVPGGDAYIELVSAQSIDQQKLLAGFPVDERTGLPVADWRDQILMVAVCEHGCLGITAPCGLNYDHCPRR